ncbi:recombination regulator RecX [Paraburkholderia rhizosphaerae]|uniref:recombination regulator RecX n=1 Tax=Paraburkholderia rhizosphaerae TaxID=480658 RepID=UPI001FB8A281|nr:recombination regulator RecX [Paraburkholderia rhizosphaerae]
MMRKGQPVSVSRPDAGGPRDEGEGGQATSVANSFDRFDPFESFDEHDRAAGRGPSALSGSSSDSRLGLDPSSAANADADALSETTYTRSRRQPGSTDSASSASRRQRPSRSLKSRAIAYLSRREYSRTELSRKLQPFVEEGNSLDSLLDTLEQEGWLSDSRFTESLVHRRASRLGANRIVGELKRQGVGSSLIEETAAQLRETELARAQAVWRKKYGQLPETPAERAKQARFLVARGFSQPVVSRILKGIDEDWAADEGAD